MFQKIAIVRAATSPLKLRTYNVQELGLARGLLKLGISVDIYSKFENEHHEIIFENRDNASIKLIPLEKEVSLFGKISYFPGLIAKLKIKKYDFIQLHEEALVMTPLILMQSDKLSSNCFLYQGMYQDYDGFGKIVQRLYDFLFKRINTQKAKFQLAKTQKAKLYLENKGYHNVEVLPIGLDINRITISSTISSDLILFNKKYKNIISYVGVIEERRNPNFIVEIAKKIIIEGKQNIGFLIVGKGPLRKKMIQQVIDLGIVNNFLFIESIPNDQINQVYSVSDLFILPSNYEIYGMVILESLFFGVPVLSTKNAGAIDILTEEKFGTCLDLDVDVWCNEVCRILQTKPEKNRLKNYILEKYDWNVIAKNYVKMLTKNNTEQSDVK